MDKIKHTYSSYAAILLSIATVKKDRIVAPKTEGCLLRIAGGDN